MNIALHKRFFCTLISYCIIISGVLSQGLINNGARIVFSGGAQIYVAGGSNGDYTSQNNGLITPSVSSVITLEGDWNNNSINTGFSADAGTVVLNGAGQNIQGSNSTTFYNLSLQGTGTKTLNVNTNVGGLTTTTGVLSLGSRPLNLNSKLLTITNPANTAVTNVGGGYVISETNVGLNPSIMKWNTGAIANTYNYPFGTAAGILIPVNVTKTTATATDISIATRPTSASDNMPWASGVLHMFDPSLNQDGSDEAVIDRWWEITSSTSIVADVTFRYLGSENTLTAPYNTGSVGSQNWSASGWTPNNSNIGSTPAVTTAGTVGSHTATGITLGTTYTPWVLSSVTAPLPIELVSFRAECVENLPVLTWHTQSETNNDFFTVEKSNDAQQFVTDGIVSGAGTTTVPQNYTYALNSFAPEMPYYRLRQTDFNGNFTFSNTIMVNGCENENPDAVIVYFNNGMVNIDAYSSTSNALSATIYDVAGRLVYTGKQGISDQKSHISLNMNDFAEGIYIVNVHFSNGKLFSKKVPLH